MIVNYTELQNKCIDAFCKVGCKKEVAQKSVDALLLAEACGVSSHGLRTLESHLQKVVARDYCVNEIIEIEIERQSFARVNCHNQIGMVSATDCMQLAINKAKQYGMFTVFANHCNTFSAAFVYSLLAARNGMIGYVMSNSPAQMAPIGGIQKLVGSNPMSYAVPANKKNPIIFDMSTSIVAKSKINQARESGNNIPEGWALDEFGNPTTDPNAAVKGFILPVGGPKGFGLAMMIDLFAGLLSNAQYLDNVGRFYDHNRNGMNVGQCFVVIDPVAVYGASFYEEIDNYIDKIQTCKTKKDSIVRIPGQRKFENLQHCLNFGIDVSDSLLKVIERL